MVTSCRIALTGTFLGVILGASGARAAGDADDARKKAQRVSSYVLVAETVTRIGIQVGGMLELHPYDRALSRYARELGRLHAKLFTELTPPQGAEELHERFGQAVADFAKAAEAHAAADYPTARKHREKCVENFTKALAELIKMKQQGAIP